jgi:CRP-like cAMP-binding protein
MPNNTNAFTNHGTDADTLSEFASIADFLPASYKKNDLIYKSGEVSRSMFFITSGVTRAFYLHEDKEVNLRLVASDNVALPYSSFITQQPSIEYVQCLTDVEGYLISVKDMALLQKPNPAVDYFLRTLAENHYLAMERRLFTLQFKTGAERYAYFLENMPEEIMSNTPAHQIASYLGLTPESFSRIKRQLIK